MSPTYILCFILLISASKFVSGIKIEAQIGNIQAPGDGVEKFLTWLTSKINQLNRDVKAAEKGLKDHYHKLVSEGVNKISDEVSSAKMFLQPLEQLNSKECVADAHSKLDAIKMESLATFKTCANLTDIFDDIKSILKQTVVLGELMFNDLLKWERGITSCLPVFTPKDVKCIVDNVFKIFDDLPSVVQACVAYGINVTNLNKKITAEIYSCTHPPKGVTNEIQYVMAQLKACSNNSF